MRHGLGFTALAAACAAALFAPSARAVQIDGRIDAQEWAQAQRIDDFRHTQPLSR